MADFQIQVMTRRNMFPTIARMLQKNVIDLSEDYFVVELKPASQAKAPVDWGTLRDTPTVERRGPNTVALTYYGGSASGWGGEPRIYAAYVEYGTRFMHAHPFLTPAIDETFPQGIYRRKDKVVDF